MANCLEIIVTPNNQFSDTKSAICSTFLLPEIKHEPSNGEKSEPMKLPDWHMPTFVLLVGKSHIVECNTIASHLYTSQVNAILPNRLLGVIVVPRRQFGTVVGECPRCCM